MNAAAERRDYEYAALVRDRLERLRGFRDELVAFRGQVEDLTFVYRVPGYRGNDRLYLIRRGRIRKDIAYPKSERARARAAEHVDRVFGAPELGPSGLEPDEAAEILLVARWFRLHPKERKRVMKPDTWLDRKRPA